MKGLIRPDMKNEELSKLTQTNAKVWDSVAERHYKSYHIDKLLNKKSLLDDSVKKEVGNVVGKDLIHLFCHIGTDTLSWALEGASVTGVDISGESLKYARRLSSKMEIEADFVESDILDLRQVIRKKFDLVFASTGVLCWIPDLKYFTDTVRFLLKDNGYFYILDGHPFRNMLYSEEEDKITNSIYTSYFALSP